MNTQSPLRLIALAGLSLSTIALLTGCSDSAEPSTDTAQVDDHSGHDHDHGDADTTAHDSASDAPHVYSDLLGEITMMPVEGDVSTALKIHHQHIPDFKGSDGEIVVNSRGVSGMMAMTMEFPPADGLSLDGFAVDDKIKFTFAVVWAEGRPSWEVTKIEKLDPSTEIDFSLIVDDMVDDINDAAEEAMDSMEDNMPDMPGHDAP